MQTIFMFLKNSEYVNMESLVEDGIVDLTDYYTKDNVNGLLNLRTPYNYVNDNFYTKTIIDDTIYTKT